MSSEDDFPIDDEEDDFLDPTDPDDAIRVARQSLSKKMGEFSSKRDSLLVLASTVQTGCNENLPRAEIEGFAGSFAEEIKHWKGRKTKAMSKLEEAKSQKEARLNTITALSKQLNAERETLLEQLRSEVNERGKLVQNAKMGYLRVNKYSKVLSVLHFTIIATLLVLFVISL